MFRMLLLVAVWVVPVVSGAGAQEPTPDVSSPVALSLRETSTGEYQLGVTGAAAIAPYVIRASVSAIGTDHGVVVTIVESAEDELMADLDLPLMGMTPDEDRCYHVNFGIQPLDGEKSPFIDGSGRLDTRACVNASGVVSFPAHDGVVVPRPAPPSDVRVVPGGDDTWRVVWTDNSSDEISFDMHINFLDSPLIDGAPGGNILASMELPEVPANWTSFGSLGFLFTPDEPLERVCGYALVLVYAIGPDSSSYLPGTTQVPACFGRGVLSFPETGFGAANSQPGMAVPHALLLMLAGVGCLAAGLWARRSSARRL